MNNRARVTIQTRVLFRIWHRIILQPKRVWLRKDFVTGSYYSVEKCLMVLVKLGLLEIVPTTYRIYSCGSRKDKGKYQISKNTKGYRMKEGKE